MYNNSAESLRIREDELLKKTNLAGSTGIPNSLLRWKFYKVNLLQVSSTKILFRPESQADRLALFIRLKGFLDIEINILEAQMQRPLLSGDPGHALI